MTLGVSPMVLAVPGEDGDISTGGGGGTQTITLNSYAPLGGTVLAGATALPIGATGVASLTLPACPGGGWSCTGPTSGNGMGSALGVGDLLMIYQPQDTNASSTVIDTSDTSAFGSVLDNSTTAHQGGLYEFVYVQSITGSGASQVVNIATTANGSSCAGLVNGYDANAMVIRVPQLRSLTIGNNNRQVVAPAWNGSIGGVIVLAVERRDADTGASNGVLAFNGANANSFFSVTGGGFRGGALDNETRDAGVGYVGFRSADCRDGARKGESIFGWSGSTNTGTGCSGNNPSGLHGADRAFGRGAIANGGGGGNAHNAGGGGGANGGLLASWNGGGNPPANGPPGTTSYLNRWARELDGVSVISAAGGPLAVTAVSPSVVLNSSSGGGRGGYSFSFQDSNATRNPATAGPQYGPNGSPDFCGTGNSATSWDNDCRRNVGGLGGRPLERGTDGVQRLYFGGGGGAGDGNNGAAGAGGAGGGLIFVKAYQITAAQAQTRFIANGAAGADTVSGHNDGPGGGGGGGTIVVMSSLAVPANLGMTANGGSGGSQLITNIESEGPGGGGGGGVVLVRGLSGSGSSTLVGGVNGTTSSLALNRPDFGPFPPNGATAGGVGTSALGPSRGAPMFQCVTGGCTIDGCFPTPVTGAWFESERHGRTLQVRFATAAEVGNAGFWIEGASTVDGSRREKVSGFVPAQGDDPSSPRFYEVAFPDPGATHLWLVDLDARGRATRRGPYAVGQSYGARPDTRQYDWTQAMRDVTRNRAPASSDAAYLTVSTAGMHRVTHESLVAAGVNLAGVPAGEIALWSRSGPVARAVRGPAVFGPGSVVEFFGDPSPDLWSRTERYVLARATDPNQVRGIPVSVADWGGAQGTSLATARAEHVPPRWFYEPASPSGSPWYQYELTATSGPVSQDMMISVSHPAGSAGTLTVRLWGGIDLEGPVPDHSVRILFNGVEVASRQFDGITPQVFEVPVTNVVAGTNVVRVVVPFDTGLEVDQVVIDGAELAYRTSAEVRGGKFQSSGVTAVTTLEERIFADGISDVVPDCIPIVPTEINTPGCIPVNFERTQVSVAGRTASQSIWVVGAGSVRELLASPISGLSGDLADSPGSTLIVADRGSLPQPAIEAAPMLAGLPTGSAEYVVITHAAFADVLAPLVAHRQGQGLTTALVDVEQLYRRYTAGNAHPDAIRAFMREHAQSLGMRFLVLAGGANYNSVGLLPAGTSTLSHIPTPYVPVNQLVNFAPGDALYGDVTGDYVAEVAVGRLPVRTVAEASEAVRKILAYEAQPATNRVLLASGAKDIELDLDFRAATTSFASTLSPTWAQTRVDVDTLGAAAARTALIDGLNFGQSLISYTGHSGPIQWDGNDGAPTLLTASQVSALPASANQPFLLQFGCWTTYFLSPQTLTMGNAWMLTPNAGASGVFGSTVLLDQVNHDAMAAAIGPRLQSGVRLGEALEAARRELAVEMPLHGGSEVLAGITLLGDPAMPLR